MTRLLTLIAYMKIVTTGWEFVGGKFVTSWHVSKSIKRFKK